jgi:hypothetical protein
MIRKWQSQVDQEVSGSLSLVLRIRNRTQPETFAQLQLSTVINLLCPTAHIL